MIHVTRAAKPPFTWRWKALPWASIDVHVQVHCSKHKSGSAVLSFGSSTSIDQIRSVMRNLIQHLIFKMNAIASKNFFCLFVLDLEPWPAWRQTWIRSVIPLVILVAQTIGNARTTQAENGFPSDHEIELLIFDKQKCRIHKWHSFLTDHTTCTVHEHR